MQAATTASAWREGPARKASLRGSREGVRRNAARAPGTGHSGGSTSDSATESPWLRRLT